MRKNKYVCWTCRISSKGATVCTRCRGAMTSIGQRLRAPHSNNKREWKKLKERLEELEVRKENKILVWERHQCKRCHVLSFKGEYIGQLCKDCHHKLCVDFDLVRVPYHRRPLCCLVNPVSGVYCNGCEAGLCSQHTAMYDQVCPEYDKLYHKWMRKNKVRKKRCGFAK